MPSNWRNRLKMSLMGTAVIIAGVILLKGWTASATSAPHAASVEVGSNHIHEVAPGRNVLDSHLLANTGTTTDTFFVFLPLLAKRWPPIPDAPLLYPIDNADQDNYYIVAWEPAFLADAYILEEATDLSFSDGRVVYQGSGVGWAVPSDLSHY